jgi:16S rRNA (adenine1518-N6/adenine1519-N6)-dimethyltransferase
MNLTSINKLKEIFSEKHPSKKLGQNFLIDEDVINVLTSTSQLNSTDTVLEIGPGLGAITKELAKKVKRIKAVEKDKFLAEKLKNNLNNDNVEVINKDFLNLNLNDFLPVNYKVVSNLPFSVTTPIIRKLLSENPTPKLISLIVQKEVAERIVATEEKHNFLSVLIHFKATPKIITKVSRNSFWPAPKVDAAILKLTPHNKFPEDTSFYNKFFKVVEAGFLHPRKQIKNNLSYLPNYSKEEIKKVLDRLSIDYRKRPEKISLKNWVALANQFDFKTKNK